MSEIDVERRGTKVWPWVLLGLLVLGIVAWALAQALGGSIGWPWVLLGALVVGLVTWAVARAMGGS